MPSVYAVLWAAAMSEPVTLRCRTCAFCDFSDNMAKCRGDLPVHMPGNLRGCWVFVETDTDWCRQHSEMKPELALDAIEEPRDE